MSESVAAYEETGERADVTKALVVLACATRGLGVAGTAKRFVVKTLAAAVDTSAPLPLVYALPTEALLAADGRMAERALTVHELESRNPPVAEELPADMVVAARNRGEFRDLAAVARALVAELRE